MAVSRMNSHGEKPSSAGSGSGAGAVGFMMPTTAHETLLMTDELMARR
jgi:hypothetical protein